MAPAPETPSPDLKEIDRRRALKVLRAAGRPMRMEGQPTAAIMRDPMVIAEIYVGIRELTRAGLPLIATPAISDPVKVIDFVDEVLNALADRHHWEQRKTRLASKALALRDEVLFTLLGEEPPCPPV